MNAKYTPGPWHANFTRINGKAVGFHVTNSKLGSLRPICESYDKTGAVDPDEIDANSHLIAAAPELLGALAELLAALDNSCNPENDDVAAMIRYADAEKAARAAITKATGE